MKRFLSMMLTFALLLSLLVVPTAAASVPSVDLSVVTFTENGNNLVEGAAVTEKLKPGDIFAVKATYENPTDAAIYIVAYALELEYDEALFEPYMISYDLYGTQMETDPVVHVGPIQALYSNKASAENGKATWTGAATGTYFGVQSNASIPVGYAMFRVKADVESTSYQFKLSNDSTKNYFNITNVNSGSGTYATDMTFDSMVAVGIEGVTPKLSTVKLDNKDTTTVAVDGETGATVNATATSAQGTNLTDMVTWSVAPTDNGVSIDATTGTITVGAKAKADDYTITATGNGTTATGSANATLKVAREAQTYTVKVTPATAELTIPVGETNAETTYRAAVTNQYGETVADPTVVWSLSEKVDGVSIDGGKVTVTAGAKGAITNSKQFTVTAKCGEAEGTASLTVKRAASVVTSMKLAAVPESAVIPADNTSMTVTLNISDVKDQYGSDAVLNGNVEWTASIADTQFAKNADGSYTATLKTEKVLKLFNGNRNEEGVTVTFTAKCGEAQDSAQVKLTLAGAVAKEIVLTSEPAGETIIIPTGDTPNTKTYTAAVKDQYGFPMSDKAALSMNPESAAGVSFDAETGKVSVSKDATADMVYKVTATCGTATASHNFTVKNKIMHADALNVMQSGFTYGESGKLAPSAALDGAAVEAAYGYTDSNSVAVDTPVNAGTYTVTARYETATDIYTGTKTFTIAPKALTAEMLTLSGEYTFNGNEQTVTYEVKDGKLLTPDDYAVIGINATNAGAHTVTVTGQRNYSGEVKKSWTIAPAVVSIEGAVAINRDYAKDNKSVEIREVTFTNAAGPNVLPGKNDYIATGMMYDANADENKPVTVTVTMKNANFTLEGSTFGTKVNIAKAAHDNIRTEMSAKYGNTATLNLKALNLPEGYTFGTIVTNDTDDKIFAANPSITGNTLSVKLAADPAKVGETGTITIPVSSTNYQNFNLIVTVAVLDKTAQTLTAEAIDTVYGESFTPNVSGAKTELTYKVKTGSESLLKYENGKFTAIGVGEATIVVTAAETEEYASDALEIKVTIAKRTLTVKAADKSAYIGEKLPELTYEVSGLVGSDKLTKEPTLKLVHEAVADPMKTAGEYVITFDQAPAADAAKYDLVTADGKLTVSVRPVYVGPIGSPVEVGRSDNGTVTVSPANAAKGTTVTITANPGKGQELKSLEVIDQNGNSLPLTDLGNGKFSFVMPEGKVTIKSEFGEANAFVNPYDDVKPGDWYYSAVEYVTVNGLMNGTGKGFEPNLATSRAMIWTILARMSGVNTASSGEWYAVAQQWAIANGVSDGTMPNGTITREQLAAMLYRYAVSKGMVKGPATADLSVFADANSVSSYAVEAMQWAVSTGLIGGMDGKLNPQGSATRAQVATMLMRFAELAR